MPYPIGSLPYPFRRRLRQLLSPAELYQLQFATGSLEDNKDLLPLQTFHFIPCLTFETPDETTIELFGTQKFGEKFKLDSTKLYKIKTLYLTDLKESGLSDLVFHHVMTANISNLYIVRCEVTKYFLEKLSQKRVNPTFLSVEACSTRWTGFTKLSKYFESFPTLQNCSFQNTSISGWVKSMLDYGRTNLEVLSIWDTNFHKLFDFKPAKLHQFVMAQKEGFRLRLFYNAHEEQRLADIESKVFPLLDQYFKPCDSKNRSLEVFIQCQENYTHHFFISRY